MALQSDQTLERRDWMESEPARQVIAALTGGGADVRFVGGCVRDALLGRPVNDLDVATPDEPSTVTALAEDAGLKVVPTGLDHGTVTIVADGQPFEVTTLREDVATDGRHALVAFTRDWERDAARRDFTMNAMSCRPDGRLFDYFGGAADARAGRVRFVGDPDRRLVEDVLRLLRFYRFHAWYGQGEADPAARQACRNHASRLPSLSGERVREELFRLLRAPAPYGTLRMMHADGALGQIVPEAVESEAALARLDAICRRDGAVVADAALRRLAGLLPFGADTGALADRLRLSNRQAGHLAAILQAAAQFDLGAGPRHLRRDLYRWGPEVFCDAAFLTAAHKSGAAELQATLDVAANWKPADFPVSGADLVAAGMTPGPEIGELLRRLEDWWIEEDFTPGRDQLLARADKLRRGA